MSRKASVWAAVAALFSVIALIGVALPDEAARALAPAARGAGHHTSALSAPAEAAWRSGGPYGGLVRALALSPDFSDDGVAFAGGWRQGPSGTTRGYGIVRTADHGQTWSAVFDSPPWTQLAVFDLAISPAFATDGTAFAATDGGLLRTRDRGNTWHRLAGGLPGAGNDPTADDVRRVYLSPAFATDRTLLALMADGRLFRSDDGGDAWTLLAAPGYALAAAFARDFSLNDTLYVVALTGEPPALALVRSINRGATWSVVQALALDQAADLVELADGALLIASDNGVARLARSGAGYASDPVSPDIAGRVYRLAVAGDHVYAAGQSGLFITLSDGRGWQRYADTPQTVFSSVAVCPLWGRCHALMAGSYLGVLGTLDDNLEPWRWLGGVRRLETKAVAASPAYATDGTLFAATEEGLFRSTDRGFTWRLVTAGEGLENDSYFSQVRVSATYVVDGAVFAAFEDRATGRRALYLSADRGETWSAVAAPFAPNAAMVLAVSPAYRTDRTIFVAQGDTLHKTTDGGLTWRSFALAPAGEYFTPMRLEVSPAYAADRTLFASGWGGVRRSTDGGETWSRTTALAPSYGLALSPAFAFDRTLWHTFRAIESAGDGTPDSAVRRSTDAGASWQWATAGLPGRYEPFPMPLAASPLFAADRTLFTALRGPLTEGLDHLLYRSLDAATTWQELGRAPGNPNPADLAVSADASGRLTAHMATDAGVWHYDPRCEDRIVNGGFEADLAWEMPTTPYPAGYSADRARTGARSLRTGIPSGTDVYSYSTGKQVVTIPAGVERAVLDFWWYPLSAEPPAAASADAPPAEFLRSLAGGVLPQGVLAGDWQYALIYDANGNLLPPRLWTRSNARTWQSGQLDLTPYRGLTVTVVFGTYNDGDGRSTAMYVDDVALTACWPGPVSTNTVTPGATNTAMPGATSTPTGTVGQRYRVYLPYSALEEAPTPTVTSTPTPTSIATSTPTNTPSSTPPTLTATTTPTATPTPTAAPACYEAVVNGGFETNAGWEIRLNPVLAEYVTTPVHAGSRSIRTGIAAGGANLRSYSPIEQGFTFPSAVATIRLDFWRYNVYEEGAAATSSTPLDVRHLPQTEAELLSAPQAGDFFYVIAIRDTGAIDWLLVEQVHNPTWRRVAPLLDLSAYAGQHIRLQFGTYNDGTGGISRTFVDDVSIQVCLAVTATPTATATRTPTATRTAAPTPTATPTTIAVPTATGGIWPTPRVIATLALPTGSHPHGIALDATGRTAYVAFHGVDHSGRTLGVVNTAPLTLTAQITLSTEATGPNGVAVIGGGGPVVVTNRQTANASVVNPAATPAVVGEIPANLLPDGVAINGGFGYIANFGNNTVTVFDPATRAMVNTVAVGQQPSLFAADPTSHDVYLSLHGSNEVQRLRDGALINTYTGIPAPYGLAFDPTSRRLYAANRGVARSVTVLDTATGTIVGTIGLDREPFVVAVNPRTGHLFIACGDQVKVYRTLDWAPVTTITVPPGAEEGIALDEARNIVYVTSREGDAITAIQDASPPLVLFASNRDGNSELYRMLPDGREQIRLTFTAGASEVSPVGSPDGRWIAYVRTDSDGWPHLWLMNRDGHQARQLTSGSWEDGGPNWSGDGTKLAFASNRDGNWEIYTLQLADGSASRLTFNGAEDRAPSWSWANGRIAFQSNRYGPNPEIFTMAPDGSDVQRVTVNPNGDRGPSWSADGQYIVFWGSRGEQTLYRVRANGLDVVPLVSYLLRPEGAAWGPGSVGGWIVFSGYRPGSGHSEIFRMTSSGADVVLLTFNEVNFDYSPGWLPGQ